MTDADRRTDAAIRQFDHLRRLSDAYGVLDHNQLAQGFRFDGRLNGWNSALSCFVNRPDRKPVRWPPPGG